MKGNMQKSYFWKTVGLKADIERHRKEELKLQEKITELESIGAPNESQTIHLRVYRNFMCLLLQSKAECTSKIGKKGNK